MASKKRMMGTVAGCGMAAAFMAAPVAQAAPVTLFDSYGFENNPSVLSISYAPNAFLVGQPAGGPASQQWSGLGAGPTGTVPTAAVYQYGGTGGTQQYVAVQDSLATTANSAEYFPNADVPTAGGSVIIPSAANGNSIVNIQFNMAVSSSFTGDPVFGLVARANGGNEVSELLVDTKTDKVVGTSFTPALGAGNFYTYELQLDYGLQQASIFAYLSGTQTSFNNSNLLVTKPFTTPATTFQYAALTSFVAAGTTGTSTGNARFDNYTVVTAVPEPASASILVAGASLLAARRRRQVIA